MKKLTFNEEQAYLNQNIIPNFTPLINEHIFSAIYNSNHEVVICTNKTAESVGCNNWQEVVGAGYKDTNNEELIIKVFGDTYYKEHQDEIQRYAKAIFGIQQSVFLNKQVISFFDLLPYNGQFKSYLVTYFPIIHPCGEVIAIQSFAHESKFFGFQEHFYHLASDPLNKNYPAKKDLTRREIEVMFLLANGLTQEQIAKTLNLSRSTIANIIGNQLSEKFNIHGANTALLTKIAIECGYFESIPESLYRPFVVSLHPNHKI
ncbi:response regulator transcription factor [Aquella oligotrophica]|uniref:Uncharacterized protein n=1 Tax=Aquella oligotrophica TaxID=2067065 RepID=A0A2I7N3E3_9NEIS|nr:helix-turn-helix transcriptional regulator [Aquella oligotrophica]AUR50970.1 hypothetical protein CUN60_01165 [Aquella oligotrophica]